MAILPQIERSAEVSIAALRKLPDKLKSDVAGAEQDIRRLASNLAVPQRDAHSAGELRIAMARKAGMLSAYKEIMHFICGSDKSGAKDDKYE